MDTPDWITMRDALAIHAEQLAQLGGLLGLRESGALGSALVRPRNLHAYGDPDLASLAAAMRSASPATIRLRTETSARHSLSVQPS
jgi:prophage maintenance system killer protein